jgi:hypothetical protein
LLRGRVVRRGDDAALGPADRVVPGTAGGGLGAEPLQRQPEPAPQRFTLRFEPGLVHLPAGVLETGQEITPPARHGGLPRSRRDLGVEQRRVQLDRTSDDADLDRADLQPFADDLPQPVQRLAQRVPRVRLGGRAPQQVGELLTRRAARRAPRQVGEKHQLLSAPAEQRGEGRIEPKLAECPEA